MAKSTKKARSTKKAQEHEKNRELEKSGEQKGPPAKFKQKIGRSQEGFDPEKAVGHYAARERPQDVLRDPRHGTAAGAAARRFFGHRHLVRQAAARPGQDPPGDRLRDAGPRAHGRHRSPAVHRADGRRHGRRSHSSSGIAQADIFGYSMGAAVALQVAIRHPEVVRKLVLSVGHLPT